MGAGASASASNALGQNHELTDAEKVRMTQILKKKYTELAAVNEDGTEESEMDIELFTALSKVYATESKKLIDERTAKKDFESFKLLRQMSTNYLGDSPTSGTTFIFDVNEQIGEDGVIGSPTTHFQRQQTSHELIAALKSADSSVLNDAEKIKSFVDQLKSGGVKTQKPSNFRKKRLTYEHKDAPPPAGTPMLSPVQALKSPTAASLSRKFSATIFAADEIGALQDKIPPFPPTIVGVFSCHGVEPGEDAYGEECVNDKINQDRGCVVCPYRGTKNDSLFMVLDGHGDQGDRLSEFTMRQIAISLGKHPQLAEDPVTALTETFVNTNQALLVTPMNFMTSGCTCVAVYQTGNKLYVANCGDSRAVVGLRSSNGSSLTALDLTRDHKPDDEIEKARIIASGGFVSPPPKPGLSARVYLDPGLTMIGLAMARSVGDYAVKAVGVTAEPEVTIFTMDDTYQLLIMASDGVWEFISSQEAVDIVQNVLNDVNNAGEPTDCDDACQELIEEAAKRWRREEGDYRDDITAIVVRLPLPHVEEEPMESSMEGSNNVAIDTANVTDI